jgi:hypothetical protein
MIWPKLGIDPIDVVGVRGGGLLRFATIALVGLLACCGLGAQAKEASSSNRHGTTHYPAGSHSHSPSRSAPKSTAHSKAAPGVALDSHGKIARSPRALQQFKTAHPCPGTGKTYGACPGYIVEHVMLDVMAAVTLRGVAG